MANPFSDVEQEMKLLWYWLNCSDIKKSNFEGNNKYLIKRRKLIEIPSSFFLLFLTEPDIWHTQPNILSIIVAGSKYVPGSSMNFHNILLGNKPSISGIYTITCCIDFPEQI